jgi:hypothetical protein
MQLKRISELYGLINWGIKTTGLYFFALGTGAASSRSFGICVINI